MKVIGRRHLQMAFGALLLVSMAACRESDVTAFREVDRFLAAAQSHSGDAGWSLLSAGQRERIYGSRQEYLDLISTSDWSRFRWSIIDERCDDGVCTVWLLVPDREAIPHALVPVIHLASHGVAPGSNAVVETVERWPFDSGIIFSYAVEDGWPQSSAE